MKMCSSMRKACHQVMKKAFKDIIYHNNELLFFLIYQSVENS